jgi:hypothetical protein
MTSTVVNPRDLPRPTSALKDDQWRRCNTDLKLGFYCILTAVTRIPRVRFHSLPTTFEAVGLEVADKGEQKY